MKRLNPRERMLAIAFILVLLGVILFQGVAKPLKERLADVNSSIQSRTEVITRAQAASSNIYQTEKEIKLLSEKQKQFIITKAAVPEMMGKVDDAAGKTSVGQVDIRPLNSDEQGGLLRHRMQLEVQEISFPTLKNFLYFLEEGDCPLIIDRVDVSANNEASNTVHATVLVSAYSLPAGGAK